MNYRSAPPRFILSARSDVHPVSAARGACRALSAPDVTASDVTAPDVTAPDVTASGVTAPDSTTASHVSRLLTGIVLALGMTACSISGRELQSVEREASTATFQWLDEQYGIVRSADAAALTDRIARRLDLAITGRALEAQYGDGDCGLSDSSDYIRYPWQVFVLHSPEPNAFSVGSGVIFVTTGLLTRANSESELAAVIAHEMAHQLLGHTREAILAHRDALEDQQGEPRGPSVPRSSFDLDQEVDADALSLRLLMVARYEPRAALRALLIGHQTNAAAGHGPTESPPPGEVNRTESLTVADGVTDSGWLDRREAVLLQRLAGCSEKLPAVESTREFRRVRRLISEAGS